MAYHLKMTLVQSIFSLYANVGRSAASRRRWRLTVPRSATTVCGGSSNAQPRTRPLPMRRMECQPGQEAQVHFGTGAKIKTFEGKRRKTHVLCIVLSHSRKGYSEACFRQTAEDFLRVLENAFWEFGGVPKMPPRRLVGCAGSQCRVSRSWRSPTSSKRGTGGRGACSRFRYSSLPHRHGWNRLRHLVGAATRRSTRLPQPPSFDPLLETNKQERPKL